MSYVQKVASVIWEDAWSNGMKYFSVKDIAEEGPCIGTSVGTVIRDNKAGITLAREYFGEGEYRSVQHIPRAMIRKVKILK